MEVLSYSKPDKKDERPDGVTVIHEPITKLVSSNLGRYRIHIHFLLDKDTPGLSVLPPFGILSIDQKDIRQVPYSELADWYDQVTIDSPELNKLEKRGVQSHGEFLIMDIAMTNSREMSFRLRMMAIDKTFTDWTPWFHSEIPVYGRLLFRAPKEYIRIYDALNYTLAFFDYLPPSTLHNCTICFELQTAYNVFKCGHTACTDCSQQLRVKAENRIDGQGAITCHICKNPTVNLGLICRRDSICPQDTCKSDTEVVLDPCRCVLSHHIEKNNEYVMVGQKCPYKLCRQTITRVISLYQS